MVTGNKGVEWIVVQGKGLKQAEGLKAGQSRQDPPSKLANWIQTADKDDADVASVLEVQISEEQTSRLQGIWR